MVYSDYISKKQILSVYNKIIKVNNATSITKKVY